MIAERGIVEDTSPARVTEVGYIGLGAKPIFDPDPLETGEIETTLEELQRLVSAYLNRGRGYTSRRAVDKVSFAGDYDHLARFGEWSESDEPMPEEVG